MRIESQDIARGLIAAGILGSPRDAARIAPELEPYLEEADLIMTRSRVVPLAESGHAFQTLLYVADGRVVPSTMPYSVLGPGFLIGLHEYLFQRTPAVWVSSYFGLPNAVILSVPLSVMDYLTEKYPEVRVNIQNIVLRRYARFCWTSLATAGSPKSRVAAALISRLALENELTAVGEATVTLRQKDVIRLTALSRTSVYQELRDLNSENVIEFLDLDSDHRGRSGAIRIPDIKRLRSLAENEITGQVIPALLTGSASDEST